jgi:hypothetical protein
MGPEFIPGELGPFKNCLSEACKPQETCLFPGQQSVLSSGFFGAKALSEVMHGQTQVDGVVLRARADLGEFHPCTKLELR